MYNFRCRTRIAGGFMIRDYVANQSKDNKQKGYPLQDNLLFELYIQVLFQILYTNSAQL